MVPVPRKWHAPFTPEQVERLNAYQFDPPFEFHTYTCGRDHEWYVRLVARERGWICPLDTCDYTQSWAHAPLENLKPTRESGEASGD